MFFGFFDPLYFVFSRTRTCPVPLRDVSHKIDVLKIFKSRVT